MQQYHLRRIDKEIKNQDEIIEIINRQDYVTLALSYNNYPYLVSLNYGYDSDKMCFYFHCANEGKKIDYIRSNSLVYGQILEDLKYKESKCSYAYRSVQFDGEVSFIEDNKEKKHALILMIEKIENPELIEETKKTFLTESAVEKVFIGKIIVKKFTGKEERL